MNTYNPNNQYRCTIIRGKSQTDMEDLLPSYVNIVSQICPCTKAEFDTRANDLMSKILFRISSFDLLSDANKKTVRNHITEIAGTLLGLYYIVNDSDINQKIVYESESCRFLREKSDNTLFFKNLCLSFQFPNGEKKIDGVREELVQGIKLKPFCFIVAMLREAEQEKITLLKQEIGYYALNNLDVLQGKVDAKQVVTRIVADRAQGIKHSPLRGSHDWQHIKEQFNLLELTNIVEQDATRIWLNPNERSAVDLFIREQRNFLLSPLGILSEDADKLRSFISQWRHSKGLMNNTLVSLKPYQDIGEKVQIFSGGSAIKSTTELGDEGEALVFKIEQERIKAYKPRLVNKVLLLGKTKGLGYDISSIEGDENTENPEFARYIEVKATRRVSEPKFDQTWSDSVNLTAKEWIAAQQYGAYYNIYRVYFTKRKVLVVRIKNPFALYQEGNIEVYPTIYQMNFDALVIEKRYECD